MPQYMALLYNEPGDEAAERERWALMPRWHAVTERLREAGVLVANAALHDTVAATTIRVRDDQLELRDGPFATTKEILAGYYLLDCADLDEAIGWARELPIAEYGSVEVRPVFAPEDLPRRVTDVEQAFREHRGSVLALLIRHVGDFDLAEEALQDAFAAATATWPRDGVPENPGGWLATTAKRRAIDRIRRGRAQHVRATRLAALQERTRSDDPFTDEQPPIVDDRLRLIFTCCHPALDPSARVALTLRALGGLTTGEIARAFLVSEPTMGKRIVRAKRKIADAGIPYRVPSGADLAERLDGVLGVIYLIFNEGYAATAGDALVRRELCEEAIRLGRLLCALMPDEPEAWALLALMAFTHARRAARVDEAGRYVALEDQDRSRWDADALNLGRDALSRALALAPPGPYALQAAIAALHTSPNGPPWPEIAELHAALAEIAPSPVAALNHAAAIGYAEGAAAGLERLAPLLADATLERYAPLHATHADLLRRAGDASGAAAAYGRAAELTENAVERAELQRRRAAL